MFLRKAVSRNKRRYQQDGYDLDLSYITKKIIAMGFPSEKLEGVFRNPASEVIRFLEEKHREHYKVYNLCSERSYDHGKFHGRVEIFPFDDHNAPPFDLIEQFCKNVKVWLDTHEENIAVVHCKAGKGRTGLMICSYLLYAKEWKTAQEAMSFYGMARTKNMKGVTIPSQIRYINYFAHYLEKGKPPAKALLLESIIFKPEGKVKCDDVKVGIYCGNTLVFTKGREKREKKNSKG